MTLSTRDVSQPGMTAGKTASPCSIDMDADEMATFVASFILVVGGILFHDVVLATADLVVIENVAPRVSEVAA